MKIFKMLGDAGFEFLNFVDDTSYDLVNSLNGISASVGWQPPKVKLITEYKKEKFKYADFFLNGGTPIEMRKSAVDRLDRFFEKNGEVLPLDGLDGIEYYLFNSQCVDALDEEKSNVRRFKSSGRISRIEEHEFRPNALEGIDIFHLPESPHVTYVSDSFVNTVATEGLVGAKFELCWQS